MRRERFQRVGKKDPECVDFSVNRLRLMSDTSADVVHQQDFVVGGDSVLVVAERQEFATLGYARQLVAILNDLESLLGWQPDEDVNRWHWRTEPVLPSRQLFGNTGGA